jgi:hypothetical protein
MSNEEDYALNEIDPEELNDLELKRLQSLEEAGIDELGILDQAKKSINNWNSHFNENIVRGKDDVNFCIRDQWSAIERSEFNRTFKPAMTFNKIYPEVKKIIGEQRKNKPDLMVRSLTGKATQEEIDLRSNLVRTISYQSQNDLVYQCAAKSALMLGYGAFQIGVDYESSKSFRQIIKFHEITDPTLCAWDPSALKPHKGDGEWCSRSHMMSKEEFNAKYPYVINPVSYSDASINLDIKWETIDTIMVCDYYVKEHYAVQIYQLSDEQILTEDEWKSKQKEINKLKKMAAESQVVGKIILNEIPTVVAKRLTDDYRIMHYRLIHNQIIDFAEWPSKYLPVIFVDGDSYYIEGRQYTKSFVHEARDAQKFINYVGSEIAAEIKNRRREQWLGTPDNIIGNEQIWRNPEVQMGILMAKPDPITKMMPTKMQPWDLSPSLMANMQRGAQDLKEIMGVSESQELMGRDISGTARRERKLESAMSTYVYDSNLHQAIEQGGRVVLDLLPYIVGKDERSMVVSQPNGESKPVTLNKRNQDGSVENEIKSGEYDVEIDAGPSFAVQKELALEMFQQTIATNPQVFPLIADLWAKNMDLQYMPQIVERFKTLVPPQILAKENGEPPPPPQPNPQMQMMQAEMQERQAKIQNEMKKIEVSQQKLALEEEKLKLDHMKMLLEAQEVKERTQQDEKDHLLDLQKIELDHRTKLTGHSIDLYKHLNPHRKDG